MGVQVFQSHCAPEAADNRSPGQMTVVLLKQALSARSLSTTGRKPELVARLEAVIGTVSPAKPPEEVCLLDLRGSPHSSCGTALSCQPCSHIQLV